MTTLTRTTYTPGWDAGARSMASFFEDGGASWQVGQAIGIICGLNHFDESVDYREIDHAFFIESGKYRIIEQGVIKTTKASYAVDAVFKVERRRGTVYYSINDTVIYTSLTPSDGRLFVDCSLYYYLDTLIGLDVYELDFAELSGELKPITGFLVEAGVEVLRGSFVPLTGSLTLADSAYLRGEFAPLAGKLLEDGVTTLRGAFQALTGQLQEVSLIPEYNLLYGTFEPLYGKLFENYDSNVLQGSFAPLTGLLLEEGVSALRGAFQPMTGTLWTALPNQMMLVWPGWTMSLLSADSIGTVQITVPAPILTAHAHDDDNIRLVVTVPAPILTAFMGGRATLAVPAPILTATGTVQVFALAALEIPAPILTATASTATGASVLLEIPAPTLTASTGAYASLEVLAPQLTATGSVGHLAWAALTLPAPILTATVKVGTVAWASLSIPAPTLEASGIVGSVAHVALTIPAMILTASDAALINETTYAVNLTTGAVTTLLLGEITRLVTAHGRLYGLRGEELVRLDGDTDGAALIPATVRFAPQTFGSNRAKRLSTVYIESREDDGMTLDVIADEQAAWRYQTATDTARAYGTHKVKVGRGVKFHTAGLVVKNRNGGRMDIGGMELLVDAGAPRPRS